MAIQKKKIQIKNQTLKSKFKKTIAKTKSYLFSKFNIITKDECTLLINAEVRRVKKEKLNQAKLKAAAYAEKYPPIKNVPKKVKELQDKINAMTFRLDEDKLKAWALRVKEAGKCDICESEEFLTAHHLWDKKSHPTLTYQDENGVCLCRDCHNAFHKRYVTGSQVTPKMYQIFKVRRLHGIE